MHLTNLIISILGSVIAICVFITSYNMNKANIQLSLYDKRYKVYSACVFLLQIMFNNSNYKGLNSDIKDKINEARDNVCRAEFLFNNIELIEFTRKLHSEYLKFETQILNNAISDYFSIETMKPLFEPYLKIDDRNIFFIDKIKRRLTLSINLKT